MTDESEYASDPEFIGMETGLQSGHYFISISLYRMPNGAIRYVADAADTANHENLRCAAPRDFETRIEAAEAGRLHIGELVRAHQGRVDEA